jgi:AraC-like DNA-binding protein
LGTLNGMYAELVLPCVRSTVEAFWSLQLENSGPRRILPDGCIDFIFDLSTGSGSVVGTMKSSQVITLPAGANLFGVRFAPGAAAAFLDAHAHELCDGEAELSALTRASAFGLAQRVAEAADSLERARVVAEFLQDRRYRLRPGDFRVRRAVALLRASAGSVAISALATQVGVGERQLERLFREQVGAGPKLLARVLRVQAAIAHLEARTGAALDAGFSDEPHRVREFRALTGLTPRALLLERRVGIVQASATQLA